MARYAKAMEFARPAPAHTLTDGALDAVERVRVAGYAKRMNATLANLVTEHDNPHVVPYEKDVVTAAAKRLAALAESKGFDVTIQRTETGCRIDALCVAEEVGFRARWERGAADGGSWHHVRDRYVLVTDPRPPGMNVNTKTAIKGKRPPGLGAVHLKLVESRAGLPMNITEIEKRVKEL